MSGLDARAARAGIWSEFRDLSGTLRVTSRDTKAAILAAMGLSPDDPPDPERDLPRWRVVEPGDRPQVTARPWRLVFEDGGEAEGRGPLPALPLGRHMLEAGGESCWLLTAPARLPLPERGWGLMVPLAGLRPARRGGIGSYDDLAAMAEGAARQGAGFIGINPVHAGFPAAPGAFSPYTPSHRRRFSAHYIETPDAPVPTDAPVPRDAPVPPYAQGELIDVASALPARLAQLARTFEASRDDPGFKAWRAAQGAPLERFATHQALSERFGAYWNDWPAPYRDPQSTAVVRAARDLAERVAFHAWLQYRAEAALARAQDRARAAGMAQGLYLDLAVGTHPHGAETWEDRESFALGASLGAPPDAFAPQGQNWHLAPFNPAHLVDTGFEALAMTLRQQLRFAGALRIDHILGFERAYWVCDGMEGAYVQMPRDAMMAVARIEATRAGAVIVGEDLGVIPEGLQADLAQSGILGCRLACFEHRGDPPDFRRPDDYDEAVIASFSTHDLPTWAGWRAGREIETRREIGLIAPEHVPGMMDWRAREVAGFDWLSGQFRGARAPDDVAAMWSVLAATRARLVAVQVEDVLGVEAQPNLPGTVTEYPNWRRRLPAGPDDIARSGALALAGRIMAAHGR